MIAVIAGIRALGEFLFEMGGPWLVGMVIGIILGVFSGLSLADDIEAQIQRDQRIEQRCIDGNNNACRVMELRRG
ncbi:hypothetical protein VDF90_07410 [Xanthomonas campestris pv. raphani]|uniref:hypothetical protein n=1 Tax=Xanthomonas campestris TaxID=339 RepID=UPI002B2310A6|nr:hypothetical protein [Xanthomonas campestris]MEA9787077.1 hypothetical protein [Xanthomonas campestris pv. raphani]